VLCRCDVADLWWYEHIDSDLAQCVGQCQPYVTDCQLRKESSEQCSFTLLLLHYIDAHLHLTLACNLLLLLVCCKLSTALV